MAGIRNMGMVKLAIMALVATSAWSLSMAQSSSDSCTNALVSMAPCLNYISGNSSMPSSSCCTQLQSVVKNSPQCLCQVINSGSSSVAGVSINQTQALTLPSACKVQTPSISRCSSGGASPSGSPTGTTPTDSTTPQGGSKATPASEGGSSDAHKILSKSAGFVPLFMALSIILGFTAL